jgi:hypothetical protein
MTDLTHTPVPARVGDLLTTTATITIRFGEHSSRAVPRGEVFEVTDDIIELSRDRWGSSIYEDMSPEAQTKRWGCQKFLFGDQSDRVTWWNGSAADTDRFREAELHRIETLRDPVSKFEARQALRDLLGPKVTSTSETIPGNVDANGRRTSKW